MNQPIEKMSIVMPCYNEEEAIPSVMPRLIDSLENLKRANELRDYELIVVNDQSTDSSVELLENFSQIKVLHTTGDGRGYGKALKVGFSHVSGDWVAFLDIDNSYRPEDLPRFLKEAKEGCSDFIMGTRAFSEKGMSFTRGAGNWVYMCLAKLLYRSQLKDVCSGYRLFHKKYLSDILEIKEDGLDFSIYLTLKMLMDKVNISQIPIQYDERMGPSKLSVIFDGVAFLKVLLTLKLRQANAYKHSRV